MARQQIQAPGIIQVQPQAERVDQFTQPKLKSKIPQEILDLSKFSASLAGWVADVNEETRARQAAQGEFEGTVGRPFGAGYAPAPGEDKNRKEFEALRDKGEILTSEIPYHRRAELTAEGRRAALAARDHVLSAATVAKYSKVWDENGNLDINPVDPDEAFQREVQPFMNVPGLQTLYGQRAATDVLKQTQAAFHAAVAEARDKGHQEYYTNEAVAHLTEAMQQVGMVEEMENSTEFFRKAMGIPLNSPKVSSKDARKGLEDLSDEILRQASVPDPRKVFRLAAENYISIGEQISPEEALRRIDRVRTLKIGPSMVDGGNSLEVAAFRDRLLAQESRLNDAEDRKKDRDAKDLSRNRAAAVSAAETKLSEVFAKSSTPEAGRSEAERYIKGAVPPEFQDEALRISRELYSTYSTPTERDPNKAREVDSLLVGKSPQEVRDTIRVWRSTGEVDATYSFELLAQVDKKEATVLNRPDVQLVQTTIDDQLKIATSGLSGEGASRVADEYLEIRNDFMTKVQDLASGMSQEDPAKIAAEVKALRDAAVQDIRAKREERSAAVKAFHAARRTAWGQGQSHSEQIAEAANQGLITEREADQYINQDLEESGVARYTNAGTGALDKLDPDVLVNVVGRARRDLEERGRKAALDWARTERPKFTSRTEADRAFEEWMSSTLLPDLAKAAGEGDAAPTKAAKPGGEGLKEVQDEKNLEKDREAFRKNVRDLNSRDLDKLLPGTYAKLTTLKKNPPEVARFLETWGSERDLGYARLSAREAIVKVASKEQVPGEVPTEEAVRNLLRTGAASFEDLRTGSLTASPRLGSGQFAIVKPPVTVTFKPESVDIWMTPVSQSLREFDARLTTNKQSLYDIATQYGVPPERQDAWLLHQAALIRAINR